MTASIPHRCANLRADFIEKIEAPLSVDVLDAMSRSARQAGDNLLPREYGGREIAHDLLTMSSVSEMWTTTPEMQDVIMHAAKSLPPQTLTSEMLPSQAGWLYLPQPLFMHDIRGKQIPIRVIMWNERMLGREYEDVGVKERVARGVVISTFVLTGDQHDDLWREFRKQPGFTGKEMSMVLASSPEASLLHMTSVAFGHLAWMVDVTGLDADEDERARVGRGAMRSMHDTRNLREADGGWVVDFEHLVLPVEPEPIVQFLHSYFHFVKSHLTGLDHEALPRSSGRWLRRLGIPNSPVTVVRLRRREPGPETGNGWQLTYRYLRRGHWRAQWYGSGDHRHQEHIWIQPTIVGPEDGELRQRDVVNLAQF